MEDVPLMKVNGDERLKFCTLNLGQLFGCHFDEHVQNLLKVVIGRLHDFLVAASILECNSGFRSPNHLQTKKSYLYVCKCKRSV